jgi:hypothetical protein
MSRRSEETRLRKAAERGDMSAAKELAEMLEQDGDMVGAERWLHFAAAAGDMEAAGDLGLMLCKRGEFKEAEPLLRRVATSNDPEDPFTAQYGAAVLGKCLISLGRRDEAEQWLVIGADAGLDFAIEALEGLRRDRDKQSYVEVHAEERGLAGRSFIRNVVGQSSLADWEFLGRIVSDRLNRPIDYYVVKFQLTYGQPIERLTGLDREEAQRALAAIHEMVIDDGWRAISSGSQWYSYRYIGDSTIVDKIVTAP